MKKNKIKSGCGTKRAGFKIMAATFFLLTINFSSTIVQAQTAAEMFICGGCAINIGATTTTNYGVPTYDKRYPPPGVTTPGDINAAPNVPPCNANVPLDTPVITPSSQCSIPIRTITSDAPAFYPIGTTTVHWTFTDIYNRATVVNQRVIVTPTLQVMVIPSDPSCFGGNNGFAQAVVSGGIPPYTYLWNNGQTNPAATGLSAGPANVVVTDGSGCNATGNAMLNQPLPLNASETHTNVACNGGATGSVSITTSGGTSPYTIIPGTTSGLAAGTIHYTIIDAHSCSTTLSVTIDEPLPISVSINPTNVSCNTGNDGSLTGIYSGGTGPYTLIWFRTDTPCICPAIYAPVCCNGMNYANQCLANCSHATGCIPGICPGSNFVNLLEAGTYSLTVTDANGCTATASAVITQPSPIQVSINGNSSSCGGILTTLNASPGFTNYSWSPGGFSTPSIVVSPANTTTYTVQVSSGNCIGTATHTLIVMPSPAPPISAGNVVVCANLLPATLVDSVPNGIQVDWYALPTGGTPLIMNSATYQATTPGTYWNEARDPVTGCISIQRTPTILTVNPNPAPPTTTTANLVLCASALPATLVDAVPSGSGLQVDWFDASSGGNLLLANSMTYITSTPGVYWNEAVDPVTGCRSISRTSSVLTVNAIPTASVSTTNVACFGGLTGSVTITPSGGTPPYSVTPGIFSGLAAGTYTYTVSDANGCSSTVSAIITQSSFLVPAGIASIPFLLCFGETSIVNVSASGGVAPYSGTGTFIVGAGVYNYLVTDANGCSATTQVVINGPSQLAMSLIPSAVICFGGNTGSITVNACCGTGTLQYSLGCQNYQASNVFTELSQGPYTVCVRDANGCTISASTIISQPAPLPPPVSAGNVTVCANQLPATLVDIVPPGINVDWFDSPTGGTLLIANSATYLAQTAGTYWNEAVNPITGCRSIQRTPTTLTVNPNPAPPISAGNVIACANQLPATLVDIVPPGINVDWYDSPTGGILLIANSATYLASTPGTYWNEARNPVTGCVSIQRTPTTLTVNPNPNPIISGPTSVCAGSSITLSVASGFASYLWTPGGQTTSSITVSPGATTTYVVTVTDAAGCSGSSSRLVVVTNCNTELTLDLKVYMEGYYRGGGIMVSTLFDLGYSGDPSATDTLTVNLWSLPGLLNPIPDYSTKTIVHANGNASASYPTGVPGNYFIAVKHRNSIETWSKTPVVFGSGTPSAVYDFTDSESKAFDDGVNPPMKALMTLGLPDGKFGMYSGDIDRNGGIDILDMTVADNDATLFFFGYNDDCSSYPSGSSACADGLGSDVDGDGGSGILDMTIIENNSLLFLFYARP